jgi:parallel beta-helix repeat protein
MSEQKNPIIIAVTLALVAAFVLGGVSLTLFPSQLNLPTWSGKAFVLSTLQSGSSVRSIPPEFSFSLLIPVDTVCINSDGSLNATNLPIDHKGDTYTFTGDVVNWTIVVQRDNIVIDGGGHKLQGFKRGESYAHAGIVLEGRSNVTISNLIITAFGGAIWVQNSKNITIVSNNFVDDGGGVSVESVNNSRITDNNFSQIGTDSVTLGTLIGGSPTTNSIISSNNITGGTVGIDTYWGSSNTVTWNNLADVYNPISAGENTTVANNNMVDGIDGITVSSGCRIYQNTILNCSQSGISVQGIDSEIFENYVANCSHSVMMDWYNDHPLGNNTLYHNNFVNNTETTLLRGNASQSVNFWDNRGEGNYWSGYSGADANGNGVGDTPYTIDAFNVDRYPLMQPYSPQATSDATLMAALFGAGGIAAAVGISALTFSIVTQRTRSKKKPDEAPRKSKALN